MQQLTPKTSSKAVAALGHEEEVESLGELLGRLSDLDGDCQVGDASTATADSATGG